MIRVVMTTLLSAVLCFLPSLAGAQEHGPRLAICSSLILAPQTVNGIPLHELSGLAWDADENLLYAITDKGHLFHFRLILDGNHLETVEPVYAAMLTDLAGEPIKKTRRDSEGLTVLNATNGKHGDTQLVIAFEGVPRLIRFTPQGHALMNIQLPKELQNQHAYRSGNTSLESVTYHPRYGFVTAPERSLKNYPLNVHTLYSTKGQRWSFLAYPAVNSGISALEALPNGNMLMIERSWSGLMNPFVLALRYVDFQQCAPAGVCQAQDLYVSSSYLFIDNYEGLTHIKGNQYLMVSDDGNSSFLNTKLTLFTLDLAE